MKGKIKIIGVIIVSIMLIIAILYQSTKPISAELLEIRPQAIASTFTEEGKVIPANNYPVYSLLSGQIVKLNVKEGQQVKQNVLLAVVDSTELELQLQQMQAELTSLKGEEADRHKKPLKSSIKSQELLVEKAQNDLNSIENDFKRIENLYNEGAVTAKEYEDAQNMLETAKLNLRQQEEALALLYESSEPSSGSKQFYAGRADALRSQMELIKYRIEKSRITAPADGVVAKLSVQSGDIVNPGIKLMEIFNDDKYEVEVFVLAESAASITEGMKVKLVQEKKGEDISFEGTVEKIAPAAVEMISALGLEEQRVKVTVKPEFPENLRVFPGSVLDVEFIVDKREGALAVPKTALFPYEKGEALWVVKGGRAKVQPVETGFENDSQVVITNGIAPGDLIILNPQLDGLKEGKKIAK
ncbi:MAG: efflux RND transporter periplasmic adaptor subunit [Thermoanaerobacteraceae bacterium]|nr:efflux RND transporter periplasmic adaptor subunit [Thermoanaerobacteraceae bacterium]